MKKLSRRQLLGMAGWIGASALVLPNLVIQPALAAHKHGYGTPVKTERRVRRWVMAIDLRYCDGCISIGRSPRCTQACILGRAVPEGMEWIQVYQAELPGGGTQFIPTPCQQCQNPPCVNVCPVAATYSTPEGVVLIDSNRCIGCRICMAACPYQRRFFNWGDPVQPALPPQSVLAEYSPEHQFPAQRGTVMKCDFCPEKPREGSITHCAQGCPNGAIYYGDDEEDIATNGHVVVKLSHFLAQNQAYHLKAELGTEPSVYYIPGYGQAVGRSPFDQRKPLSVEWPWAPQVKTAQKGGARG